jgi:hypothetical protein
MDPLSRPLRGRRLADARLADQNGVVLGAAGEDLDGPAYLVGATRDGVELADPGLLGQVPAVLVERDGGLLAVRGGSVGAGAPVGEGAEPGGVQTGVAQHPYGLGVGAGEQGAKDVPGTDAGGAGRLRVLVGGGQRALGARGEARLARLARAPRQHRGDTGRDSVRLEAAPGDEGPRGIDLGGGPEQMLGLELEDPALLGLLRGEIDELLRGLGQEPSDGDPLHRRRRRGGRHTEGAIEQVAEGIGRSEGRSERHRHGFSRCEEERPREAD